MRIFSFTFLLLIASLNCFAQKDYFDFWVNADWKNAYAIYQNDTVRDNSSYEVAQESGGQVNETWIHLESGEKVLAQVNRFYDDLDSCWYMLYTDKNFATVWKAEATDGIPMFQRKFALKDRTYFSRQYWKDVGGGKALHIIEKSDDGNSWTEMYRSLLVKEE